MTVYHYKARDKKGKAVMGMVEASSIELAGVQLDSLGYIPILIKEEESSSPVSFTIANFFGGSIQPEDMIMFSFQISTLIDAGIPLLACLKTLEQQLKNPTLKNILMQTVKDVEAGSSLSDSLAKHPKAFPEIYINMIRVGEATGKLPEIFMRLGQMAEHEAETIEKIDSAIRYPKMVLIALGLAFVVVMAFVIPRFISIFERFKIVLPLPTRLLIAFNMMIQHYWFFGLIGLGLLIFLFKWYTRSAQGRYVWDNFKLRIPIWGPLFQKVAMSRFAHILGMLNQSGLPIIENLRITAMTIGNVVITTAINKIRESVQQGRGLAETMKDNRIFTPLVVQMVSVGESSGSLDDILIKLSRYYDMEVEQGIKKLSAYIEPLLILVLGIVVLFFALSIFLPMWDLTNISKIR